MIFPTMLSIYPGQLMILYKLINRTAINWILPCACWFKWNCNGSQLENHGNGGILYFVVDFEV